MGGLARPSRAPLAGACGSKASCCQGCVCPGRGPAVACCPPNPRQRDVKAFECELNAILFWLPFCFQTGRSGDGLSDGCRFLPVLVRGQEGSASSRCPVLGDGLRGSRCVLRPQGLVGSVCSALGQWGCPKGQQRRVPRGNGSELTGAVIVWRCKTKGCLRKGFRSEVPRASPASQAQRPRTPAVSESWAKRLQSGSSLSL